MSAANASAQILFLGLVFIGIAFIGDSIYALLAGALSAALKRSTRFLQVQKYVTGGVYVALGFGAALAGSSPSE